MNFPKPYADLVAKLRVPCGFILVIAFVWLARPSRESLLAGLPIAALGLALRAWAAGYLEKDRALAKNGPYARVRNPLYLGTLIVAAGFAAAARRWELGALFAIVFLLVYLPAVQLEEQHLRDLFADFEEYSRRVPRVLPRWNAAPRDAPRFRWSLYKHNREYQALAGFLAGVAALLWKAAA